jgi:hypothetical protein
MTRFFLLFSQALLFSQVAGNGATGTLTVSLPKHGPARKVERQRYMDRLFKVDKELEVFHYQPLKRAEASRLSAPS